jgi:membrane protease YdiL (CAAX protease family)
MFFQKAKEGNNHWAMYVSMVLIVILATFIGQLPLGAVVAYKQFQGNFSAEDLAAFQSTMDLSVLDIDKNLGLLLMLVPFALALLAMYFFTPVLLRRPFRSLITPNSQIAWRKMGFAFLLWFAVLAASELIGYLIAPTNYELIFDAQKFLGMLLVAVPLIPLQAALEEVFFRGFLMQGLGLAAKNRWFPFVVTSLLFGLMHFANPEVSKFGLANMMVYYVSMGLLLGALALLDGGLELPLGVHIANNFYGATITTFSGSALQTNAIFRIHEIDIQWMLPVSLAVSLLVLFVLVKKYGINDWSRLYGPINFDKQETDPLDALVEK